MIADKIIIREKRCGVLELPEWREPGHVLSGRHTLETLIAHNYWNPIDSSETRSFIITDVVILLTLRSWCYKLNMVVVIFLKQGRKWESSYSAPWSSQQHLFMNQRNTVSRDDAATRYRITKIVLFIFYGDL